jgi:eukaryotic-like serine/threonine-protein kinase
MTRARHKPRIGRYEVLGELAVGGMAEILLGRLTGPSGFERLVVIKRALTHLAKDPDYVTMFFEEARTVARIRHRNVVQVHELDQDLDDLFLAMEYLEGESVGGLLRRLWAKSTSIDPFLAAYIVAEACRGLHAAHELADEHGAPLGLVHRDVSPQNLFVTYEGTVKVLDFGIAKVANRSTQTEPGQIKGKFAYMSPEQCNGKQLDRRSDIFSMGIVLYELVTGRRLFAHETEMLTLRAICEAPVAPPSRAAPGTPPMIDEVCLTALARPRDERYASCAEMSRQLLDAMRAMGRTEDPEQALAALMHQLYPDRIEEKRELVRRARLGAEITSPPSAESDENIELPRAEEGTQLTTVTAAPAPPRKAWSARTTAGVVTVAVALVAAGAAGGRWWKRQELEAPAAAPPTPVAEPVESAALPAEVTLQVTATPTGTVVVDGRSMGETPLAIPLPRSTRAAKVTVSRAGYLTYEQTIVPDADQRLVITLTPLASGAGPRFRPPPPTTTATAARPPPPPPPARPEML